MKVVLNADKEKINTTLNQIRGFRENFLQWVIKDESPAENADDVLFNLRLLDEIDNQYLSILKELEKE